MTRYIAQTYIARTPQGDQWTGTAQEIADWLQRQDWQWGEAGQEGHAQWRQAVAARVQIQSGQVIDPAAIEAGDPTAFLVALAVAGTIMFTETISPTELADGQEDPV